MKNHARCRKFVSEFTRPIERAGDDEACILDAGGALPAERRK